MLGLSRQRSGVLLMRGRLFLPRRTRLNPFGSTVIARGPRIVHHHGSVIDMGHVRDANVGDGPVVVERSSTPLPSRKSHARIAESVVNSAIEADVRSPVASVPSVESSAPSPISGRPQHADGRNYPGARHPVVAGVIVPGPVPGGPEEARSRTNRLRVNRQQRRADADRDANRDLRKRCRRKRKNDDCQQQPANCGSISVHCPSPPDLLPRPTAT